MTEPGYVYFLFASDLRRLKIGYSAKHPRTRARGIQTSSPIKLKLLGFIRGTQRDEVDLHAKFVRYRQCGEWFSYSEEIREYLREVLPEPSQRITLPVIERGPDEPMAPEAAEAYAVRKFAVPWTPEPSLCCAVVERHGGKAQCRWCAVEYVAGLAWCRRHANRVRDTILAAIDPSLKTTGDLLAAREQDHELRMIAAARVAKGTDDAAALARVYGHVQQDPAHMADAARRAKGGTGK